MATFGGTTTSTMELMFGVPAVGATVHPLNVRLHLDDVEHVSREAEDGVVFVDASLTPVLGSCAPGCPTSATGW